MRIALVNVVFRGGQTTHVDALAHALARAGDDVLVAYVGAGSPASRPARRLQWVSGPQTRIGDAIAMHRPDVVHAHSQHTWRFAAALARRLSARFVATVHRPGLARAPYLHELLDASAVICPGPDARRSLHELPPERIAVIANGIDLERWTSAPRSPRFTVTYAGRVDRRRLPGFRAFVAATRGLDADVRLAGILPRGVAPEHVRVLGWLADPLPTIAESHVVVGIGRSLLEGMACGAAAIALGERLHGLMTRNLAAQMCAEHDALFFDASAALCDETAITTELRSCLHQLRGSRELVELCGSEARGIVERWFDQRAKAGQVRAVYLRSSGARVLPRSIRAETGRSREHLVARIEQQRVTLDARLRHPARWAGVLRRELFGRDAQTERARIASAFDDAIADTRRRTGSPLDRALVCRLHDLAVGGSEVRTRAVRIGRYRHFAPPPRIAEMVDRALATIAEASWPAPYAAAWLHAHLVLIHPFADGNGRTARLAAALLLLRAGYRSTLFTCVEQHSTQAPGSYIAIMSELEPGASNEQPVWKLVAMMAARAEQATWFRERRSQLERACAGLGFEPAEHHRVLANFDLDRGNLSPSLVAELSAVSRPWWQLRSEMPAGARIALIDQLERLRMEEHAQEQEEAHGWT